jgi:hypothetical protein
MLLMNKVRRTIDLKTSEKTMYARTILWLWYFTLRNTMLPFRLSKKWIWREVTHLDPTAIKSEAVIRGGADSVRMCSRFVPGATCLVQALAAKALLRHYGQESSIRLGVSTSDESIDAHA